MNWLLANFELVVDLSLNHMRQSVIPIVLGFVLAIPIGRLTLAGRGTRGTIITITSLLYTIPSLPLFVILPTILGTKVLSETNLIVALTIYAVAIMVRASADAFSSVPVDIKQAATAMGFSPFSRFWRVEFPLAGPVLLAGVRVVSVSTIALTSVGVLIGAYNLGYLFTNGKARTNIEEIGVGIVASLLIALLFDVILVLIGRLLMPWSRLNRVAENRGRMAALSTPIKAAEAA